MNTPTMLRPFGFVDNRFDRNQYVWPVVKSYDNGNVCLVLMCETEFGEEPWARATVNIEGQLSSDCAFFKDYSENEGLTKLLLKANIISGEPIADLSMGFVTVDCYKFSNEFYRDMVQKGEWYK